MTSFEKFVSALNPGLSAEAVLDKMIDQLKSSKKLPKEYVLLVHPDKLAVNTSVVAEYLKSRKDAQGQKITLDFYFKGLNAWSKEGKRAVRDEESDAEPDDGQTKEQLKAQEKEFIDAAKSGTPEDVETVKKLFARSSHHKYLFNVNAQNEQGYTALMMAVANNHLDIVKVLLGPRYEDTNLNLKNSQGQTALKLAVKSKNKACVKLLLHAGATPLSQKNKKMLAYIKTCILEELQASKESQEINFYTLKLCTRFFPAIDLESECVVSSACATKLLKKTLKKLSRATANEAHYKKMALWLIANGADLKTDYEPLKHINNKPIPTTLFDAAIRQGNQAIVKAMIAQGAQPGLSVSVGFNAPKSKYIKKLLIKKGCVGVLYQNTMKSFEAKSLNKEFKELIAKDLILETLKECIKKDTTPAQALNVLKLYTQIYPKSGFEARKLFKKKWPTDLPSQSIFKTLRDMLYSFINSFFRFFKPKKALPSKDVFSLPTTGQKPRATVEQKNRIDKLFKKMQSGNFKASISELEATHLLEKTLYTLKIGLGALDQAEKIKMKPQDSINQFSTREDQEYQNYKEIALQLINNGAALTDVSIESVFSIMDETMLSAMIDKLLKEKKNQYIADGLQCLIALSKPLPKKFKQEGAQEKAAGLLLRAGCEVSGDEINGISLIAYCQPLMIPTLEVCIQENDSKGALNILNRCYQVYPLDLYPQAQSLFSQKWPTKESELSADLPDKKKKR